MSAIAERNIRIPKDDLAVFCERNHVVRLSLFGSVIREDFREGSDVDVLVEFDPQHAPGLLAKAGLRDELTKMLGRQVDLRVPRELSKYVRQRVLDEAEVQYVRG